ncbi:MAG TPA: aminotransferase class I/II-fold pyridoxal phosphate-dependent enzyme [Kofleriaceae bacterium]|nr:aminotransferase class I/II-fold pyridoxal phosphate-dependent enzyme [Kofleriaceae bacterium]
MTGDIAITGMACRFPRARDLGAYWRNIHDARVCFSEIPAERWNHALFYDASPRAIDKTYARKVGLLDDVKSFAAMHYGLAPLRVTVMDPQHRLLLDAVREAIEDAGWAETALAGSRTGVYVGASVSEYKDLVTSRLRARAMFDGQWGRAPAAAPEIVDAIVEDVTPLRAFSIAGNLLNMAAATVAQTFDLRGPAFTIDAACSSSLVATCDAVLALRAGVCDRAIAGGVYLNLTPDNLVGFSRIGAISPSDACRPFDEKADGFVLGEGVGAVVLRRLDDALRDGDRIYAVIRGVGINNDGRGEGPMTPRFEGQLDAIARAHAEVDFTPDAIGFVEAHGTATGVGDATELGALRDYFAAHAGGPIACALSSVKANIGHTMSAAGVAGLIKTALVIDRAIIPPQAGFARPHERLAIDGSGFHIATEPRPFRGAPRRAAVSSFGFGGTNCHLVLEQAPERRRAQVAVAAAPRPEPFFVSAPSAELLAAHLGALRDAIADDVPLADLAHALATRGHHAARVGFVARTHAELRDRLAAAQAAVRAGASAPGVWFAGKPLDEAERAIAMLFPGQGAQTLGLGRALYDRFPAFRARLDELAAALDGELPQPLLAYLYPRRNGDDGGAMRALTATEVCQPAMAAIGLAMCGFAEQLGIAPRAYIGHSLGEFVALAAGGAIAPRDAVRFVGRRGKIMAELPLADRGAMAAVQGDRAFVERHLDGARDVVIANLNHPKQTVISGASDAVLAASARLAAAGATVTRLEVSHAFHSPLLAITDQPLAELVGGLDVRPAARTVVSCIRPGAYPEATDAMCAIMARHATSTVDFVGGVRALAATGAKIFVQAAAGSALLAMARATLRGDATSAAALVALGGTSDDDGTAFVEALVELAVLGVPVALARVHDGEDVAVTWLPPTPLPTERYWCATRTDAPKPALPALAANPSDDGAGVVALFRQQMDVLAAHAEIMRRQAEVLTRDVPVPVPVRAPTSAAASVPAPSAPAVAPSAPAPAPVAKAGDDSIEGTLLDVVAQVSAFPRAELQPSQRLVADLGFDSLMIVELAVKAGEALPGLKGLPKTLFAGETTIGDVVAHVRGALRNARPADTAAASTAPAELARFVPRWIDAPLATLSPDAIPPFAGPIAILADRRGIADALARRLRAAGVAIGELASARGAVDLRPLDSAPGPALERSAAELRGSLEAALAAAQTLVTARPTLFAVAHAAERDGALAGFAKALAREWPDARVKAIALDPARTPDELAAQLCAELVGSDATVEVSLAGSARQIVALEAAPAEPAPLRDGAVVAITGGARGLGGKIALELARRHRARLVLLGRTPNDELVAAIAAAGGEAMFAACDVRDAAAVAAALERGRSKLGPIEAVVHAAGVIADAAVEHKDRDKLAAVFDTKVGGWLALERATRNDPVRVALALGSWSGRFGNAQQTDYAAANQLVAALAAAWTAARPQTRALALDLPPWDGSTMASTIPAAVRAMMRSRGVPFLDDARGLAAVLGELAAPAPGEVVLAPEAVLPRDDHARIRIGLDSHAYLGDHRIHGAPVLPLAAATDYIAAAGQRALGGHVAITALELCDGVRLDAGPVELDVRARGRGDDVEVELAAGGKLAYRARVVRAAAAGLPALERPAVLEPAPLALDEFYARHTFHGPRLRGIATIDGLDATHIAGTVRAARPGELGERAGNFAIDPLVIDASFQLAAYFMHVRHRRAGLPLGFDELRLLAPLPPGARIGCLVRLEAQDGDVFVGNIDYRDPLGRLVAQLRGVRGAFRPTGEAASAAAPEPRSSIEIPPEHYKIEAFPECVALRARIAEVDDAGIDNPYFNVHERVTADTAVIKGREVINFSTYNYVGLSGDPAVSRAAIEAIGKFGTSVSASRIASGEKPLHRELETTIAKFLGTEDAIVMVGGHATNVSVIGHIVGPGDLVMHDSLAHDSILGGIKLSGARRRPFPHNDWKALDDALRGVRGSFRRVLIAIEGVYSMDGDIPELPRFIEVKQRHKALMLVDEAHSLGVLGARGAGIGELYGVRRGDVELWMGTLSKSLASCGGYIAGTRQLVEYLKYTNPGFVYSVGISPPNAAAALAALRELQARPKLVATVQARAKLFLELCRARGIDTGFSGGSAVVPAIIGDSVRCMLIANALADAGINVQPIIYPAVEEHLARLRFFISARHTEAQLKLTADTLAEVNATFNRTPRRRAAASAASTPTLDEAK